VVRSLTPAAQQRDEHGWNFGSAWPPSYEAFGRMRALATLQKARALRPRSVLEVAAGDGSLSACLATNGAVVVANDLRGEGLTEALQTFENGGEITALPGNCFDLDPAQTGRFELVIACEIIEHVAYPVDLLRHLRRFLNPEGRILLSTPNGLYFRNALPTYAAIENPGSLEMRQFQPDADGHLFLLTVNELSDIAAQADLRVEEVELYATPFITGHCGMSRLSGRAAARLWYSLEKLCQQLPSAFRERLCCSMTAVLRPAVGIIEARPR